MLYFNEKFIYFSILVVLKSRIRNIRFYKIELLNLT